MKKRIRRPQQTPASTPKTQKTNEGAHQTGSSPHEAPREVLVKDIDWSLALRGVSRAHIERLAGAVMLPAVVVWEQETGRYRGIDGFHRWYLAQKRGQRAIEAVVRHYDEGEAGERQFDLDCISMNIQHGLPLTRVERDRAVIRIWNRWGRRASRPDGISLDELGRTFNLTKQRIHQIITSRQCSKPTSSEARPAADSELIATAHQLGSDLATTSETEVARSGFSEYGRFTAAARRLTTVLGDMNLVQHVLVDHPEEVRSILREIRDRLEALLQR
jgi:hypothetical protein